MNQQLIIKKLCDLTTRNIPKYQFSSSVNPKIIEQKHIESLYEKLKHKIYFSSVFYSEFDNLSFKKKQIVKNVIRDHEMKQKRLDDNVKPFPISLQYLNTNAAEPYQQPILAEANKLQNDLEEKLVKIGALKGELENLENANTQFKKTWMQDYEYFNDAISDSTPEYGTPDPSSPISQIPCGGCGALLHCADSSFSGYIPSQIYKDRTQEELRTIICQRCHFLKNYNIAIDVNVTQEEYIKILSTIKDKHALAILLVDIFDFPNSIFPGIIDILGTKRPVFLVGNKIDLLPRDSKNYLKHIGECLTETARLIRLDSLNIQHTCLISATTGYGIEDLITHLHNKWKSNGDVYLVGCTNVGKSSLFNALLQSDFCKVQASSIVQKATASPWPGTTLRFLKFPILRPSDKRQYIRMQRIMMEREQRAAEEQLRRDQAKNKKNVKYTTLIGHIGKTFEESREITEDPFSYRGGSTGAIPILTLNEKDKDYAHSKWCFDTPGVVQNQQIINQLTTEELLLTLPREVILPRTYLLKPKMTIFLAGLGRLDYLPSNNNKSVRVTVYASQHLPVLICDMDAADEVYSAFCGTYILGVPIGDAQRLKSWPKLESSKIMEVKSDVDEQRAECDFVMSSAGWIGLNMPRNHEAKFLIWTPAGMGIVLRRPSLLPHGDKLKGSRVRGSLAYRNGKFFV